MPFAPFLPLAKTVDGYQSLMNQQELRAASAIGLLYLIRMLGLFMVLPVLPLVAPEIVAATPVLIGLALGIHGLSQSLLQIPLGMLSDRWGRKPLILAGLSMLVLGSFVAAFSTDIYGLVFGRFLQGCGAISGVLLALLSDLTRVDQRSKAMAIVGIAIAGSFGLALVLGPFIAARQGLGGVFLTTGFLGLAGLLMVLTLLPTPRLVATHTEASLQPARLLAVLTDRGLWRINLSIFLLHFLLISAFMAFPLLLRATGEIEDSQHSSYYLALLLGAFILMSPLMWLADKVGDTRPIILGMVVLLAAGFGLMALPSWPVWWLLLVGITFFFMGFNLLEVLLPAQLSKLARAGARGTAMGVYTTCQFLGVFAGGLVGGLLAGEGFVSERSVSEALVPQADIATLLYVNIAVCGLWLLLILTLPGLGHIGSRTVILGRRDIRSAQEQVEALLSIRGVIEAVIVAPERQPEGGQQSVAYLKVDVRCFDDSELEFTAEGLVLPDQQTGDNNGSRDK